jgi:hypothetical protein
MFLVNARLLYNLIDGYQYSLLGQVKVTVNSTSIALLFLDQE